MASRAQELPPWMEIANIQGVVITRRGHQKLWVGRALAKLRFAKSGYMSEWEPESITWRQAPDGACVSCGGVINLPIAWSEPGIGRLRRVPGRENDFFYGLDGVSPNPVKVMDAVFCAVCKIERLPRLKIYAQWDLREDSLSPSDCGCSWTGRSLILCGECELSKRRGALQEVGEAEGWQVRKFVNPLMRLDEFPPPTKELKREPVEQMEGASAPLWEENETSTLLSQTEWITVIEKNWPYNALRQEPAAAGAMGQVRVCEQFRILRPSVPAGDELNSIRHLAQIYQTMAMSGGWLGPWELTTWGRLAKELVQNSEIPWVDTFETLPTERGRHESMLHFYMTRLDGWSHPQAKIREKVMTCRITPETSVREKVVQIPGSFAHRASSPYWPEAVYEVDVVVKAVVVPCRGLFSFGLKVKLREAGWTDDR